VYPPIIARQWLGKNITAATNTRTQATTEELSDVSSSTCHIKGNQENISSQNSLFLQKPEAEKLTEITHTHWRLYRLKPGMLFRNHGWWIFKVWEEICNGCVKCICMFDDTTLRSY
jgi:hypothetical protein